MPPKHIRAECGAHTIRMRCDHCGEVLTVEIAHATRKRQVDNFTKTHGKCKERR